MLNIAKQGTYEDPTGNQWVFYQDDATPSVFYVIPRPQYIVNDQGTPTLKLVTYDTNTPSTDGSGFVQIGVELSVPQNVQGGIASAIQQQFGVSNPTFGALQCNLGGMAYLTLDGQGQPTVHSAPVSSFGSNQATFVLDLDADGMKSAAASLTTHGGAFPVRYALTLPARLPEVTAVLSFDSSIAYQYQVTQPQHHTYGSDTPGSVQALLTSSGASTTTINWGIKNPPESLEQTVASWANTTLADMVNAEVQEQLQIQGMTSSESFNINSVNSFTNTFNENEVVTWTIQPQAVLPSLADLGLGIAPFSSSVNEQLQVMTVMTDLPFQTEVSDKSPSPFSEVKVQHATVTAGYPGLPEAQATVTFTRNGHHTFTAPFNPLHGPGWSVSWDVTYAGGTQVTGNATADQGQYTLSVSEVGILTVTFNAAQVFLTQQANVPASVTIDLSFMDPNGGGHFINQQATIDDPLNPMATITSLNAVPITTTYNYTVTYNYADGTTYTAPSQCNQSGFTQTVPFSSAVQATPVYILYEDSTTNPILGANVKIWYQSDPAVKGAAGAPTESAPTEFQLLPSPIPGTTLSVARDMFESLVNSTSPLVYSASINTLQGQIAITGQMIASGFSALEISPTQRYFTLSIVPATIDWTKCDSVLVTVTPSIKGGTQPAPTGLPFTFNFEEKTPQYMTLPLNNLSDQVSYEWTASYIAPGKVPGKATGAGTATDVFLLIPPTPAVS